EEEKFEDAAKFYGKASSYKPNKYYTPIYLMKEGLAYEKLNDKKKAINVYQKILDNYWESAEYQNARKFKARLEANS
ncbi:MAG TPA: cytochrome C biosynthesis protein, partial [Cyclobacteriaceae bacterium]|nr:cytochrome C biosynthesis protein [Cyclobacteriaceae bacterium]